MTLYCNCTVTNLLIVALAVYTRSPAAYEALRSFKLLQLPCVWTLKYYIDFNLEKAGEVEKRLIEKKVQYDRLASLAQERLSYRSCIQSVETEEGNSQVLPIAEGSPIIEVKV